MLGCDFEEERGGPPISSSYSRSHRSASTLWHAATPHVLDSSQSKIICGGRISSRQRHASKITIYAAVLGVHGPEQMCGRDGELVLDARQCDVHGRVVQHLQ